MYERIALPAVLYGTETRGLNASEKKEIKFNGNEMSENYIWCDRYRIRKEEI